MRKWAKQVLELATGTGLIAKQLVRSADHIEVNSILQNESTIAAFTPRLV